MSRQITEPQRAWLLSETEAWLAQGLITEAQVKGVLGLYATRQEGLAARQSRGLLTLMALALVSVALGALLLVGYNWEGMPAALKVGIVVAGVVGSHGLGLYLRFRLGMHAASEAAFFFGCLLYGAGIWLLAQVFHVSAGSTDGWWWWALGVFPFALLLDTLLLHSLLVGLLAVWAGFEVFGNLGSGQRLFRLGLGGPHVAYTLLPLAAPGFWWAYRKGSPRALALYVPLLTWWVVLQGLVWGRSGDVVFFIGAVGAFLLLAAEAHAEGSPMAVPYRFYGAVLVAGALVPLTYHGFHERTGNVGGVERGLLQALTVVALGVLVLTAVVLARRRRGLSYEETAAEIVRRQWLPCGMVALMAGMGAWDDFGAGPLLPTIAANLAMLTLALWLIRVGLRDDRGRPFAAGVAYFLFWAVLRYIDLFGAFGGMLGGALVFFLCGACLFGLALFWRQRKVASDA